MRGRLGGRAQAAHEVDEDVLEAGGDLVYAHAGACAHRRERGLQGFALGPAHVQRVAEGRHHLDAGPRAQLRRDGLGMAPSGPPGSTYHPATANPDGSINRARLEAPRDPNLPQVPMSQ